MQYRSLSAKQRNLYHETVSRSHHRRITVLLLDLSGRAKHDLSDGLVGGDIQGDTSGDGEEVVTDCEVQILDTARRLEWAGGEERHYQLRVIDERFVPDLTADGEWVEEVAFTGPVWSHSREGDVVTLVAHGPERNVMGSFRTAKTWPKKTRARRVMRECLQLAGAKPYQILVPRMKARLPDDVTVGVRKGKKITKGKNKGKRRKVQELQGRLTDTYWGVVVDVAEAVDREAYADGRGRYLVRAPQKKPAYHLGTSVLLAPVIPRRPRDGEQTNEWLVLGRNPKGKKKRRRATVRLPAKHPLSRESLAFNGTPREITERIENDKLRTNKACRRVARRHRDRAMRELVEYQVEALPVIPWLRPNSLVSVALHGGGKVSVRVKQWTLPLGPSADPLVIGTNMRRKVRTGRGRGGRLTVAPGRMLS